ncbi:olfactory receptor 1468-like [Pseudophryne corroboree]|uniref:olfactory receptor 1468-like n=1 Tax=Pseudophryne corroboree TaxID=495146 RepID=UPI0030819ADD
MNTTHQLNTTDFFFKGLSESLPLFLLILLAYVIIICGNVTIITVICEDSHLHTPMYIFLLNLSIIDIASTSITLPKLLNMLITQYNVISFTGCMIQMFLFLFWAGTEVNLLAAMAYDRYVAICHPLHYVVLMSLRRTAYLSAIAWVVGFYDSIVHTVLISRMSFCSSHLINHFFCDILPLLQISCSDVSEVETLTYIDGTLMAFTTFLLIILSYSFIISSILKIKSSEGQIKAFSTCTSHLTCVIMYYGTLISLHMRPTSNYSPEEDMYFALLYVVLVPMLNPFIYSLKNKEFQKALAKSKSNFGVCKKQYLNCHVLQIKTVTINYCTK